MLDIAEQAKLRWRCRRGMLELDLLLERFCVRGLPLLTMQEAVELTALLELPDPDLLACLLGYAMPMQKDLHHVVARIQSYTAF